MVAQLQHSDKWSMVAQLPHLYCCCVQSKWKNDYNRLCIFLIISQYFVIKKVQIIFVNWDDSSMSYIHSDILTPFWQVSVLEVNCLVPRMQPNIKLILKKNAFQFIALENSGFVFEINQNYTSLLLGIHNWWNISDHVNTDFDLPLYGNFCIFLKNCSGLGL